MKFKKLIAILLGLAAVILTANILAGLQDADFVTVRTLILPLAATILAYRYVRKRESIDLLQELAGRAYRRSKSTQAFVTFKRKSENVLRWLSREERQQYLDAAGRAGRR